MKLLVPLLAGLAVPCAALSIVDQIARLPWKGLPHPPAQPHEPHHPHGRPRPPPGGPKGPKGPTVGPYETVIEHCAYIVAARTLLVLHMANSDQETERTWS
jgi:hypothetical protein